MNEITDTSPGEIGFVTIAVWPSIKRRLDARQARIKNEQGGRGPSMTTMIAEALDALDTLEAQAVQQ